MGRSPWSHQELSAWRGGCQASLWASRCLRRAAGREGRLREAEGCGRPLASPSFPYNAGKAASPPGSSRPVPGHALLRVLPALPRGLWAAAPGKHQHRTPRLPVPQTDTPVPLWHRAVAVGARGFPRGLPHAAVMPQLIPGAALCQGTSSAAQGPAGLSSGHECQGHAAGRSLPSKRGSVCSSGHRNAIHLHSAAPWRVPAATFCPSFWAKSELFV